MKSKNPYSGVHEEQIVKTLDTQSQNPSRAQGGNILLIENHAQDSRVIVRQPDEPFQCITVRGGTGGGNGPMVLSIGNGQIHSLYADSVMRSPDCMHDQQAVITSGNKHRKYILRRITPLECCRLQGFPDWWAVPGSDAAQYKMWGNGVALPCVEFVMRRIYESGNA